MGQRQQRAGSELGVAQSSPVRAWHTSMPYRRRWKAQACSGWLLCMLCRRAALPAAWSAAQAGGREERRHGTGDDSMVDHSAIRLIPAEACDRVFGAVIFDRRRHAGWGALQGQGSAEIS